MKWIKLTFNTLIIIIAGYYSNTYAYNNTAIPAYRIITVGKKVLVNQALIIKPNLARIYFQNGEILPEGQIDRYYPNCSLEIKTLSSSPQKILPDEFTIYKITVDEDFAMIETQYASLFFGSDGPSPENWATHFYLRSEKQPDVYRLHCQHWEDPADARHVTYEEIKKALGKYISINL